jgi:hypothetical protein
MKINFLNYDSIFFDIISDSKLIVITKIIIFVKIG